MIENKNIYIIFTNFTYLQSFFTFAVGNNQIFFGEILKRVT